MFVVYSRFETCIPTKVNGANVLRNYVLIGPVNAPALFFFAALVQRGTVLVSAGLERANYYWVLVDVF